MSLLKTQYFYLSVIFVATIFLGCSRSNLPKDIPKLYSVTIMLTQENIPLANASVFLYPTNGTKWNAGGTTGANGKVELWTHGKYYGVSEGRYKIIVNKYEVGPEKPNAERIFNKTGNYPMPDSFSFIDIKYTNLNETPLEITVAKNKRIFSFDLGPAVRVLIPNNP